jgi:hypothetical protein
MGSTLRTERGNNHTRKSRWGFDQERLPKAVIAEMS